MSDKTISALTAATAFATTDAFVMAVGGNTRKVTAASLYTVLGKSVLDAGTITFNQPYTVKQTWNEGSSTFNGLRVDITDTASLAASNLIEGRVGGNAKYRVNKDGSVWIGDASTYIRRMLMPAGSVKGSMYGGGAGPATPGTPDTNAGWGLNALLNVTTGGSAAFGFEALKAMTTGVTCAAFGDRALTANVTGSDHVAVGPYALQTITAGVGCTAVGMLALNKDNGSGGNTGLGDSALRYNETGVNNVAVGYAPGDNAALTDPSYNVFVGARSARSLTGSPQNNVFIGESSGFNASQKADANNSIALGANTFTTKNNQVVLGNTSNTETILRGAVIRNELSADPDDPAEGTYVTWMSDGTGSGDDGDIMIKITAGGVTKTATLVDFSAV